MQFLFLGKCHVLPELCLWIQFLRFGTPFNTFLLPCAGFFPFPRSLIELCPCKASHAVCDGNIDFPSPVVDGRIDHLVQIGRVLTVRRGCGLGKALMEDALGLIKTEGVAEKLVMEAQSHAIGFYERLGFRVRSDEFLEDGIPHVMMEMGLK